MSIKNTDSLNNAFNGKRQAKDNKYQVQMKRVFKAFQERPKTMLMVSIETGILRANICRYVAKWQRTGQIMKVRKGLCFVSNCSAGFYTTNSDLFPEILKSLNPESNEY